MINQRRLVTNAQPMGIDPVTIGLGITVATTVLPLLMPNPTERSPNLYTILRRYMGPPLGTQVRGMSGGQYFRLVYYEDPFVCVWKTRPQTPNLAYALFEVLVQAHSTSQVWPDSESDSIAGHRVRVNGKDFNVGKPEAMVFLVDAADNTFYWFNVQHPRAYEPQMVSAVNWMHRTGYKLLPKAQADWFKAAWAWDNRTEKQLMYPNGFKPNLQERGAVPDLKLPANADYNVVAPSSIVPLDSYAAIELNVPGNVGGNNQPATPQPPIDAGGNVVPPQNSVPTQYRVTPPSEVSPKKAAAAVNTRHAEEKGKNNGLLIAAAAAGLFLLNSK